MFCLGVYVLYHLRKPTALKEALNQLDIILEDPLLSSESKNQIISLLIKQLAVTHHGREAVAGLSGSEWVEWIESKRKGKALSEYASAFFLKGPYSEGTFLESGDTVSEIREILHDIGHSEESTVILRIKRHFGERP